MYAKGFPKFRAYLAHRWLRYVENPLAPLPCAALHPRDVWYCTGGGWVIELVGRKQYVLLRWILRFLNSYRS